jgi:predicted small lipoprotein YifL
MVFRGINQNQQLKTNKMKRKLVFVIASVMMLATLAGCGKLPQEQIDAAKAAIETARTAEADIYTPDEFRALQNEMNVIMANIEAENSKTFKDFKEPTAQLDAVVIKASTVVENAELAKATVGTEVQALLDEVNNLIAENKTLVTQAPKGKEGAAVIAQIQNEMSVIEASVADAANLFQQGKYMAVRDKLKAAIENVTSINNELKEAISKVKRR